MSEVPCDLLPVVISGIEKSTVYCTAISNGVAPVPVADLTKPAEKDLQPYREGISEGGLVRCSRVV